MKKKFFTGIFNQVMHFSVSPDVAKFIAAQCCLESDFGLSRIAHDNHNLFGMKLPHSRVTTAIDINHGHAVYNDPLDSIIDYMLWLEHFDFNQKDLTNLDRFKRCLKASPYCPKPDYVERIEKIYEQYK